jgi:2,5-diamino-6-(ribosylamino)-4(3H)-pyrimidinone 5'-phosphate reductase
MTDTINGLYLNLEFPEPPDSRPHVYINMVASVDGKITLEGSERGIGSDADQRLFHELRAHADAVLDGATTARISGASPRVRDDDLREWRIARGKSPHPLGVLITASGNLDLTRRFFTSDEFEAVVFAAESMPPERLAALRSTRRPVHVVPEGIEAVAEMLRILRAEYGVQRLLCEGGGTLNAQFIHLNAADDFFLTIAPKIVAGRDNLTPVEGAPFTRDTTPLLDLTFWHHHHPTGEVFTRWRFRHPGAAGG